MLVFLYFQESYFQDRFHWELNVGQGIMLPSIFEKHKIFLNRTKSFLVVN